MCVYVLAGHPTSRSDLQVAAVIGECEGVGGQRALVAAQYARPDDGVLEVVASAKQPLALVVPFAEKKKRTFSLVFKHPHFHKIQKKQKMKKKKEDIPTFGTGFRRYFQKRYFNKKSPFLSSFSKIA